MEIGILTFPMALVNAVVYLFSLGHTETKHTHIHLHSRVIVKKHHHARSNTYVHMEICLVSTCKLLILTLHQFALSATQLQLHLVEESEALTLAE